MSDRSRAIDGCLITRNADVEWPAHAGFHLAHLRRAFPGKCICHTFAAPVYLQITIAMLVRNLVGRGALLRPSRAQFLQLSST